MFSRYDHDEFRSLKSAINTASTPEQMKAVLARLLWIAEQQAAEIDELVRFTCAARDVVPASPELVASGCMRLGRARGMQ